MDKFIEFLYKGTVGLFLEGRTADWLLYLVIAGGIIACVAVSYFLGSLNFALIISRRHGGDIRSHGSGNAGATNMLRTYGRGAAVMTLGGDALKAVASVAAGYCIFGIFGAYLAGLFCIIGHIFPVYYKFKGGKGVVTAAVAILMLNPLVFALLLLIFVLIVAGTKFVSLGSVMCMAIYPLLLHRVERAAGRGGEYVIIAMLFSVLIILMHRENIKRLMNGTEPKISFGKNKKK